MLHFTPNQQDFEAEIPAFADSEQRISGYLIGHIQRVLSEAEACLCLSNQNLAPASPARVQALREDLLRKADKALGRILYGLQRSETWTECRYAKLHRTSLLWLPLYAERYGLAYPSGAHVGFAEFEVLRPDDLVRKQDTEDQTHVEMKAIELLRVYMATHVLCSLGRVRQRSVVDARNRVMSYFDSNAHHHFELYENSSAYQANHFKPYENGPDDPCFFFG